MKSSRIPELDILRAFAFLFVVAQHIFGGFAWRESVDIPQSLVLALLNIIAFPAVPIFIALNAVTLLLSVKSYKSLDVPSFYAKKFKFIIIPYILVSLFLLYDAKDFTRFNHLFGILLTGSADYHLWYMGTLLRILIFFPIILVVVEKFYLKPKPIRNVLLIGFVFAYWLLLRHNAIVTESIAHFLFNEPSQLQMKFITITPALWSIYFVLGIRIAREKEAFFHFITKRQTVILWSYFILLAYNFYDRIKEPLGVKESVGIEIFLGYFHHIFYISFMLLTILVFFIFSKHISQKKSKITAVFLHISAYSYPAYLIHTWILAQAALPITGRGLSYSLPLDVAIYLITVVFSVEISHLLSYLPFSQYLTGLKRYSPQGNKKYS